MPLHVLHLSAASMLKYVGVTTTYFIITIAKVIDDNRELISYFHNTIFLFYAICDIIIHLTYQFSRDLHYHNK